MAWQVWVYVVCQVLAILLTLLFLYLCDKENFKRRVCCSDMDVGQEAPYRPRPLLPPPHENYRDTGSVSHHTQAPSQPGLTVTTTTSVPVAQPPYPVAPQHPVPQPMMAPGIGFHNAPPAGYPPYPVAQGPPMPQPYPPVSNQAMAPPPSYHEAVGQPLSGPSVTKEHYAQQSPYNPHY